MKVKLLKPHNHGGKDYETGDEITLRPDQAERLKGIGVATIMEQGDSPESTASAVILGQSPQQKDKTKKGGKEWKKRYIP